MLNLPELVANTRASGAGRLERIGDLLQYFVPWGALLLVALNGNIFAAQSWLLAGVATSVITHLLKLAFNNTPWGKRPDGGDMAFPSAHTSSAFMGAVFMHLQFGLVAALLFYALAALTGYSRVVAKRHWWRDVIGGALLAAIVVVVIFFLRSQ